MFANHANNKTKTPAEGKSKRTDSAPGGKDAALLNPVWQSLARRLGSIQPKLTVSQPDDPYERDADQIADRVMRMPNNGSRADGNSASPPISPPARHQHNSPESNQESAPTLQSSLETGAGQALPRDVQKHRDGNAPRDEARAANDSSQANPVWQSLALRSDVLQPKDAVRQP